KIRKLGREGVYYKHLAYDCNIPGIKKVAFHEESGTAQWLVISMKKTYSTQPWQALHATFAIDPMNCKMIIAVDDDIDPEDVDAVIWAMSFGMQPHRDVQICGGKTASMDPSAIPPGEEAKLKVERPPTSSMLIDATRKWAYPPVALPRKEFMERARKIWEEEGLPKLSPKSLWYGYSLGDWSEENAEEAELALRGDHYQTGEKIARQERVKS
ncbi:UbiD family decarboxylase, partial [Chloroflexota bacterium]